MADSKAKINEKDAPVGVQSVTDVAPKEADKVSGPYIEDASHDDPPVRTVDPQQPIAQVLAAGAGEHVPPDDPHIGADGRYYADPKEAEAASAAFRGEPAPDAGKK